MQKSREEMLNEAELRAKEASTLLQEFVTWKTKVIAFAKDGLFYQCDTKAKKNKATTPEKLITFLNTTISEPKNLNYRFKLQDEFTAHKEAEKKAKEYFEREKVEELKLTEEALMFLQEHGKVIGIDFTLINAVNIANNLAAELEVNRRIEERCGYFDFDGTDTCDESCTGWDGESHRCSCGNRRVSWEADDYHSFKTPSIHAVSY